MVTFIEIILGANEGSRFKIEDGLTIGRAKSDIVIKDPKISGVHAQFFKDNVKEHFILADLNSSNGIHISGRRVKKVALLPGVIFEIGRTQFKVVTVQEQEAVDFSRFVTWRTVVSATAATLEFPPPQADLSSPKSFSPALKLRFIQGIQTDEELTLGYGPRYAGSDSLDIEIQEEKADKQAFELHPGPGMVELRVLSRGHVTLNNKTVKSEMLKDGDLIGIGKTLIRVTYL